MEIWKAKKENIAREIRNAKEAIGALQGVQFQFSVKFTGLDCSNTIVKDCNFARVCTSATSSRQTQVRSTNEVQTDPSWKEHRVCFLEGLRIKELLSGPISVSTRYKTQQP